MQRGTDLDDVLREAGHLCDMDAKAPIADAGLDLVQEGDVAAGERGPAIILDMGDDVQVLDVRYLLLQSGELVKVRCVRLSRSERPEGLRPRTRKQAKGLDLGRNVFGDGPGESEAFVGT